MKYNIILIVVLVLLFSTLGLAIRTVIDDRNYQANEATAAYNHGICTECGGKYRFSGSDRVWCYYTCEKCDHTICSKVIMK